MNPEYAAKAYIEKVILPSNPLCPLWNKENFIFGKPAKWNYIDNCMIKAVIMLYHLENDGRLLEYAEKFMGAYIDGNGNIPTMREKDHNLDNINGGKNLLELYRMTGMEKYRLAAEHTAECLASQPRLKCGNFWHKQIYPNQIWLDGIYMALPFLAEYGLMTGQKSYIEDVRKQLENVYRIMRDSETGLYYHGYDETHSQIWADHETGLSPEFWLRSLGWLGAGLADISEIVPEMSLCREMLSELLFSAGKYSSENGMFMQLPAYKELDGNYPETSGTLLLAYSSMKAERLGICGNTGGYKSFCTVTEKYMFPDERGVPVLENICLMGGLGGDRCRDGSAEYYTGERVVKNDAKGIAPWLMSYAESKKVL